MRKKNAHFKIVGEGLVTLPLPRKGYVKAVITVHKTFRISGYRQVGGSHPKGLGPDCDLGDKEFEGTYENVSVRSTVAGDS